MSARIWPYGFPGVRIAGMNTAIIEETQAKTLRGELIFPQVVGAMLEAGVERYTVDLIAHETTYYSADGKTQHRLHWTGHSGPVAPQFDADTIKSAIKAAQRDELRYPAFIDRVMAAGCAAYTAYLTGKRVTYIGRQGDSHTELFPQKP